MSDRISELSDDLLCKILCYLPNTKHAAATFFLSKRWKSVWLKLPSLYFEDEDYINHAITPVLRNYKTNYTSRFAQFVNSILSVDQPIIKKFRLKCKLIKPRPSDFTRWINTAIQRNVEELDIFLFSHRRGTTLPIDVFTCTKLVVLKLRGIIIEDKIDSVCLPSLRILSLKGVGFSSEDCVVKLLSCSRKTLENVLFSGLSNIWPKYILHVAPADTPSFHNLITLNISLVSVINWEHVLMRLIQNSPKLQNLSIEKGFKLNGGEVDSWNQPQNNVPGLPIYPEKPLIQFPCSSRQTPPQPALPGLPISINLDDHKFEEMGDHPERHGVVGVSEMQGGCCSSSPSSGGGVVVGERVNKEVILPVLMVLKESLEEEMRQVKSLINIIHGDGGEVLEEEDEIQKKALADEQDKTLELEVQLEVMKLGVSGGFISTSD
ncbi:F-box/LRR-repeat protein [Senna tora]|uniref:F-box/LRR-repeat protein n=1 Tax=Senna tora TaxID=362788 RepID=A0A834X4K0_9FABA|nr:F-box/LRR-repeat protein [Senna tora]